MPNLVIPLSTNLHVINTHPPANLHVAGVQPSIATACHQTCHHDPTRMIGHRRILTPTDGEDDTATQSIYTSLEPNFFAQQPPRKLNLRPCAKTNE